jgi:5'-nucleotidase
VPLTPSSRPTRRGSMALAVLALFALTIPVGVLAAKPPAPPPVTIQILNVSDWHGQLDPLGGGTNPGGAWSLAARFTEDRLAYPSLTLTAGDDYGATPPLSSFFGEVPAVLGERMMGIQVGGLGNHNFDRGIEHLQEMIDLAGAPTDSDHPGSPYVYVSANLRNRDANIEGVSDFAIFDVGGVKVGVVGITNPEAPSLVSPDAFGTIFVTDPYGAANRARAAAKRAGADIVVAVTHMGVRGFDADGNAFGELIDFANNVAGFAVIFGDHTDVQFSGMINGQLVHENRSKGATYAKTLLTYSPGSGKVIDRSVSFVTPTAPARTAAELVAADCPDPALGAPFKYCDASILEMLSPYRLELAEILDVQVATATATFVRGGNIERRQEVALGNLIAEGMLWFQGTDFALMNGGGIRAPLPSSYVPLDATLVRPPAAAPWDLVLGDVYSVLPFTNTVLRRTITGTQLWAALENGVSQISATDGTGGDGRFPQIAGFRFAFDYAEPTGCTGTSGTASWSCTPTRVYSVTWPDGTPIPADGTLYTLAIPSFVNQGGDSYRMFLDGNAGQNELLDATVMSLYLEFLGDGGFPALTPATDGRIGKCSGCAP